MKCIIRVLAGFALLHTFGAVSPAAPDPLETWTWRNPLPQGDPLYGAAYGNGVFVAVGPNGTVVTSTDGFNWLSQNPGTPDALDAIAFGNELFVATDGLYEAKVHVSADGLTWEPHAFPSVEFAQSIAYDGGQFITVGLWGTILASTNSAADWTLRIKRAGPGQDLNGIATDGNRLVAVSAGGGKLSSTNGIDWTQHDAPGTFSIYYLYGITAGNGRFVAVGATNAYNPLTRQPVVDVSADGLSWEHQILAESGILWSVAFGNGQFVAVGEGSPSLVITSADGRTWTRRTTPALAPVLRDVVFARGRFVAVGNSGHMVTSTNALDWVDLWRVDFTRDLYGVAYGNGSFVVVGKYGVATSPDGLKWQTSSFTAPATEDFSGVDFVGGVFLASTTRGTLLSEDGSDWSFRKWILDFGPGRVVEAMGSRFSVGHGGGILQSAPLSLEPLVD